jgi:hypothetical protein
VDRFSQRRATGAEESERWTRSRKMKEEEAMDQKQKDEINATRLEVTKTTEAYAASVARYRAAINPTDQEFNAAEVSLSADEDDYRDHLDEKLENLITGAMDYEEGVLDQILEQREENEEEDDEQSLTK